TCCATPGGMCSLERSCGSSGARGWTSHRCVPPQPTACGSSRAMSLTQSLRRASGGPMWSRFRIRAPSALTSPACWRPRWRSQSRSCSATWAGSARSPRQAPECSSSLATRPRSPRRSRACSAGELPSVSVLVAAYAEEGVMAARLANSRALDYPPQLLEVIVACDGSPATAQRACEAGADVVLELPRGGKIRAQDAAVKRSGGDIVAFSDANVTWQRDALKRLVAPFVDSRVGYVCGEVQLVDAQGSNQEGL